jgi:hypothetical protein
MPSPPEKCAARSSLHQSAVGMEPQEIILSLRCQGFGISTSDARIGTESQAAPAACIELSRGLKLNNRSRLSIVGNDKGLANELTLCLIW